MTLRSLTHVRISYLVGSRGALITVSHLLTHMDVYSVKIEAWRVLPPGLIGWQCALPYTPLSSLPLMEIVQHLTAVCTKSGHLVNLRNLVALLHVWPHLTAVGKLDHVIITDLLHLHGCILAPAQAGSRFCFVRG